MAKWIGCSSSLEQPIFQNPITTQLPLRLILTCQIWLKLAKEAIKFIVGNEWWTAQSLKSHFLTLKIERKNIFYLLSLLVIKKFSGIPFRNLSLCDYTLLLSFPSLLSYWSECYVRASYDDLQIFISLISVIESENNSGWKTPQALPQSNFLHKAGSTVVDQVAQGFSQAGLKDFQEWRLHSLLGTCSTAWLSSWWKLFSLYLVWTSHFTLCLLSFILPPCSPGYTWSSLLARVLLAAHSTAGLFLQSCFPDNQFPNCIVLTSRVLDFAFVLD